MRGFEGWIIGTAWLSSLWQYEGAFAKPRSMKASCRPDSSRDSAAAVAAALESAGADLGFVTLDAGAFTRAAAKSIDYAAMERTAYAT